MKGPGAYVKLRVAFGDVPRAGSVLELASGRRYWVTTTTGKTLHCRVMAPGDPVPEHAVAVLAWRWAGRAKTDSTRMGGGKPLAQSIGEFFAHKAAT